MQKMISFDGLADTIAELRGFIARNAEKSSKTPQGRTSEFWSGIFDGRDNLPDLNALMTFRRAGNSAGVDHEAQGSMAAERFYNRQMAHQFGRLVPLDFAASLPEPVFGAPYVFEQHGLERSAAFWIQSGTSHRVLQFAGKHGPARPLRVLEIGGGIGTCAFHLHCKAQIESYTIVDLPENLYLSSLYLTSLLPDRRLRLHEMEGPELTALEPGTLNFCFPGTIDRVATKFDLIVNSFSMHEMTLENVQTYIAWIGKVLADDGIFVSLNSHAKAGVRKPTDYRFGDFHIHHWGVFRQTPLAYFNTIAYEVVIGKRQASSPVYSDSAQDALGWLMQLGLDGDLRPFAEALVAGSLSHDQSEALSGYLKFFNARTDEDREAGLKIAASRDRSAVLPFVKAHFALVREDYPLCRHLLEEAVAMGLVDFARVRAGILLSAFARMEGKKLAPLTLEGLDIALSYPDAQAIADSGNVDLLIAHANKLFGRAASRTLPRRIMGRIGRMARGA